MKTLLFLVSLVLAFTGPAHAGTEQTLYMDNLHWRTLDDVQTELISMQGTQPITGNWAALGSEGSFIVEFTAPVEGLWLETHLKTSERLAYWGPDEMLDPGYVDITYFDGQGQQIENGYFMRAVVDYAAPTFSYSEKNTQTTPYTFYSVVEQAELLAEIRYLTSDYYVPHAPEPETYAMMLAGLGLLAVRKRQFKGIN